MGIQDDEQRPNRPLQDRVHSEFYLETEATIPCSRDSPARPFDRQKNCLQCRCNSAIRKTDDVHQVSTSWFESPPIRTRRVDETNLVR